MKLYTTSMLGDGLANVVEAIEGRLIRNAIPQAGAQRLAAKLNGLDANEPGVQDFGLDACCRGEASLAEAGTDIESLLRGLECSAGIPEGAAL